MLKTETVHIDPHGFREYDARWLYPKDINLEGIKNIGQGFVPARSKDSFRFYK